MNKKKKIIVTGGTGRFGSVLKRSKLNYKMISWKSDIILKKIIY